MKLKFFHLLSLIIITFSFQLVLSNCRLFNEGSNQVQNIFSRGSNSDNSLATEIIALPVVVESVKRSDISSFLSATTTLSAERSLDIVSSSSGTVVKVTAKEGDRVGVGDILVVLDSRNALLSLEEAKAHYDNAERIFQRTSALGSTVSSEELEDDRYQLKLRKISLEKARDNLAKMEIKAPIDGLVVERTVDTGTIISANSRLFKIIDKEPLLAIIHVPYGDQSSIKINQEVIIDSDIDIKGLGKVVQKNPLVDASSGTVKVTIELESQLSRIALPGMFVQIKIPIKTSTNALVIPKRAVLIEDDESIVYQVLNGKAIMTSISLGLSADDVVEVTEGLSYGMEIVVVGQESLRDGAFVRMSGDSISKDEPLSEETQENSQSSRGRGDSNFSLSNLPPERREAMIERILNNDKIMESYQKELKSNPDLATNDKKRLKFFEEKINELGGPRAIFGSQGRRPGS